jgi:hypothetical protein
LSEAGASPIHSFQLVPGWNDSNCGPPAPEQAALTGAQRGKFHCEREDAREQQIADERVSEEQKGGRKFRATDGHGLPPSSSGLGVERIAQPGVGVRRQIKEARPGERAAK